MNRRSRGRRQQTGQVIIVLALAMIIVLGMVAVAIDGSYGLVQERRDQNAADFASLAGTQELRDWCLKGTSLPSDAQVYQAVQSVLQQNGSNIASWQATYVDGSAPPQSTGYTVGSGPNGYPPPNACGVSVQVRSAWAPSLAEVIGFNQMSSGATGIASNSPQLGNLASIYSIDPAGPHAILGGGSGTFVVSGDVYINTETTTWAGEHPANNPWTRGQATFLYNDAIDAKGHSNIYIFGVIHSPNTTDGNGRTYFPLDTCFGSASANGASYGVPPAGQAAQYQPGVPLSSQSANQSPPCNVLSPKIEYDGIDNTWAPRGDPLNPPTGGGIPDPLAAANAGLGACPGSPYPTYTSATQVPGYDSGSGDYTTALQPAVYDYPVVITSSVDFADCSGAYDPNVSSSNDNTYPGVFRFPAGLDIALQQSSDVVRGNNVMFATGSPIGIPGNVPGTDSGGIFTPTGAGNGGPCVPFNAQSDDNSGYLRADADQSASPCAGTSSYPTINYAQNSVPASSPPNGPDGDGANYSLIIGGVPGSKVTLAAPYASIYHQVLFFQQRTTPGNFGFDAMPGDGASDTFTGLIYNASLPASHPFGFWDPTGVPFNPGGTLQAGYGVTSNSGSGWNPSTSSSSVTVNGICVVDDFLTDGASNITILGTTYNFPNGGLGPGIVG